MRSRRKGGPRRRVNPIALPSRDGGPITAADLREDDRVVSGPQAALCARTMSVITFARYWRAHRSGPIDWTQLPALDDFIGDNEAHHEPSRRHGGLDRDTVPLTPRQHRTGFFPRHGGKLSKVQFWRHHEISDEDLAAAKAEMRRRANG